MVPAGLQSQRGALVRFARLGEEQSSSADLSSSCARVRASVRLAKHPLRLVSLESP